MVTPRREPVGCEKEPSRGWLRGKAVRVRAWKCLELSRFVITSSARKEGGRNHHSFWAGGGGGGVPYRKWENVLQQVCGLLQMCSLRMGKVLLRKGSASLAGVLAQWIHLGRKGHSIRGGTHTLFFIGKGKKKLELLRNQAISSSQKHQFSRGGGEGEKAIPEK